ncbi:ATP-binding protein [Endozoicomonas sp. SCSIO W0465]|uniref:ATP-binding protein n=1 Tax=Endozoicomonas sp. SCSIO W0465 TaxID=2918516 RepID=UPI002075AC4A|nr:SbcC/MukB-like Walker B domain-containing protein [Endozoicomonas sp. SCSIO W0465]USE38639.1 ATP-dependent exonuclease SbcCD, C subunit-like protein [Endozoicomonas sp. SCSIO W0465]
MQTHSFDFSDNPIRAGFRLASLEVLNWGTFHKKIWVANPDGDNSLLTGDIGSGKSTLVDGLTTLLVPSQKITYNKAAGAETRERNLTSYVRGYYKSAKDDDTLSAKAVALRDHNSYSVLLARFVNEGFDQTITLAQVFWSRDNSNTPERFYVVARKPLSIARQFSGFGSDIADLKKKLKRMDHVKLFDSFSQYQAEFRRQMGIDNDQALELLYQTVSMKSVGNLTEFVRSHMLESTDAQEKVNELSRQFDNLNRAHEAVLKARQQIDLLAPLIQNCDQYEALEAGIASLRQCREALYGYFADQKITLLTQRIERREQEQQKLEARLQELRLAIEVLRTTSRELERAIDQNGGQRLSELKTELERLDRERSRIARACDDYLGICRTLELPEPVDDDGFYHNRQQAKSSQESLEKEQAELQNRQVEHAVTLQSLRHQHQELEQEITSLKSRQSNIPSRNLAIRQALSDRLDLPESTLPFAGELLQVREEDRHWEGAVERVLHNFALSLLVPDEHYQAVADYVDRTHLKGRLVYYRVRQPARSAIDPIDPRSLCRKVSIKTDSQFYTWLEQELAQRFDYICCDQLDDFRRETRAITTSGQIKSGGSRHEKDDRYRIDDRSRFVLGWSNREKIFTLEASRQQLEEQIQQSATAQARFSQQMKQLGHRQLQLELLLKVTSFADIHWQPLAIQIDSLEQEKQQLESGSDILRTLRERLEKCEARTREKEDQERKLARESGTAEEKLKQDRNLLKQSEKQLAELPEALREQSFPTLAEMEPDALGERKITIESCDSCQVDMRKWLQNRLDKRVDKARELSARITGQMADYKNAYPQETREVDAAMGSVAEFSAMLDTLQGEDLPRHEQRFKQMLNEGTIHNMAMFQNWLDHQQQTIRDKIATINRSLAAIDYSEGTYIRLVADNHRDPEINQFKIDLRNCLGDTLSADNSDDAYAENKFLQVKTIVERFNGREGQTELDKRWTRKVTDVRNWFLFNASERYREDDSEKEFYSDAGGKSGGQKEKLAYTILAAALAYQLGLEWGENRSRSFRFVMIDEAFGRGSDESARYGLELFRKLNLQLLIVTPLQKIHVIEDYVNSVHFVHNQGGNHSMLRNLTIEQYRQEKQQEQERQQQREADADSATTLVPE